MPLITPEQEAAPERRTQSRRGLRMLLLVPPACLLLLLLAAAVRPVQLGPVVVMAERHYSPDCGWRVYLGPSAGATTIYLREQAYVVTGRGQAVCLYLGDWLGGVGWFYGHRKA